MSKFIKFYNILIPINNIKYIEKENFQIVVHYLNVGSNKIRPDRHRRPYESVTELNKDFDTLLLTLNKGKFKCEK